MEVFTVLELARGRKKCVYDTIYIQSNLTNPEFAIIRTNVFFSHYDLDDHIAATENVFKTDIKTHIFTFYEK
jgi:hypothetical protein